MYVNVSVISVHMFTVNGIIMEIWNQIDEIEKKKWNGLCVCLCVRGCVSVFIIYKNIFQIGEVTNSKGYIRREVGLISPLHLMGRHGGQYILWVGTYNIYAIKESNDSI